MKALGVGRGLGWMFAALWWAARSPAGPKGLAWAALPWAASSFLARPTAGLSVMFCVALYAPLALWSARRAVEHFAGQAPGSDAGGSLGSPGLGWALGAGALVGLCWSQGWASATGLGEMLRALGEAKTPEAARAAAIHYWNLPGFEGAAWPLAFQQLGLAAVNAWWCLLPFAARERPQATAGELARAGLRMLAKAPMALLLLGGLGALAAQSALAFAPLALLSGLWFGACAFAWRDLAPAAWGAVK
jgi:hypothetical protein